MKDVWEALSPLQVGFSSPTLYFTPIKRFNLHACKIIFISFTIAFLSTNQVPKISPSQKKHDYTQSSIINKGSYIFIYMHTKIDNL